MRTGDETYQVKSDRKQKWTNCNISVINFDALSANIQPGFCPLCATPLKLRVILIEVRLTYFALVAHFP